MFELPSTAATLQSVTNRREKHGDDDVPAVTLGVQITGANTLLDKFSPKLRETLYKAVDGQEDIPDVEKTTPLLRCPGIEYLMGSGVLEGWTVIVEHGIDDSSAISLKSCKLDKFRVFPKEGGTVDLLFRVGTSDVDAISLGNLGMKIGQQIKIRVVPPRVDGGGKSTARSSSKRQKELEAAGQRRLDDDEDGDRADAATRAFVDASD